MSYLDPFFGPGRVRNAGGPVLPQRSTLRFDDGGTGIVSDDPIAQETLIDLSSIVAGGSGTGMLVHYTGTVNLGDVLTSAGDNTDPTKVQIGNTANLATGASVRGVAAADPASGKVLLALPGAALPTTVTGLTASSAGYVVASSAGRCVKKQPPAFGDAIVGFQDTNGLLHVLPQKSRVSQHFLDPREYGSVPGDTSTDGTVPTLAALADTQVVSATPNYPTRAVFRAAPGATQITKPLRVTQSYSVVEGHGEGLSTIRPNFQGPWCVVGPDLTDVPPVRANGPFGGYALNIGQDRNYCIDLGMVACGLVAGLSAFTVEAHVEATSALTGGDTGVIVTSWGKERSSVTATNAFLLMLQSSFGFDTEPLIYLTVGGVLFSVRAGASLTTGAYHHVAASWDGGTIRLFVDGVLMGSTSTAVVANAVVTQQPWEGIIIGRTMSLIGEHSAYDANPLLRIGPTRGSAAALYTSAFTAPTAAFANGDPNDLWVFNWDAGLQGAPDASDVFKGWSGGTGSPGTARPVWAPIVGGRGTLDHQLDRVCIRDLTVYGDNGATPGGVFVQQTLHVMLWKYRTQSTHFHAWLRDTSFESHYSFGFHNGTSLFPGFINRTTSGDVFNGYNVQNCSYPYLLSGGQEMNNCTIGAWGKDCAGVHLTNGTLNIDNCFWDGESQFYPSRGAIFAEFSAISARGIQGSGGLLDNPFITLDTCDADLEFRTQSNSYSSCIVDVLAAASNQIKLKGLDYGTRTTPVMSSTGADLGKVTVECKSAGDAVGTSIRNNAGLEQYHGDAATTNGTAAFLADCAVTLDPHTSATIDVVIDATRDNDTDCATFKISEKWQRGRLGTNPAKIYAVSTPINIGSAAGGTAPPTGWAAALALDSGAVKAQVTGASASKITWSGNIVVTRGRTVAPSWTPIELAPKAWFRGDVGTGASWTDQSGNGFNAAAGTTAPVAAMLGSPIDQACFDFAGGAWFQNTADSLLTAGGPVTILAVFKAADTTGGTIFACRRDTSPLEAKVYFLTPTTYILSSGGGGGGSTVIDSPNILRSPYQPHFEMTGASFAEWTLYPLPGVAGVRLSRFDLNGVSRVTTGNCGDESGAAGFMIGKSGAYGQPWNGKIAELVILNRSITVDERAAWRAYVLARYGR